MRLPSFSLAFLSQGLAKLPDSHCWDSGHTRAACCYDKQKCFDEKCCADPFERLTPAIEAVNKLPLAHRLQQLIASTDGLKGLRSPVAATSFLHKSWKYAQIQLDLLQNRTLQGELPSMDVAFQSTLMYFVSLQALHRSTRASMQAMLRREVQLWLAFTRIYNTALGQRDFCRCVEAGEFYSRTSAQLLQTGVGSLHFPRVLLNGSTWEHRAISLQNCRVQDARDLEAKTLLRTAHSSQCIPGDLSALIGLLHGCILEKEFRKVISLHEGIFQLATFAQDCLDTQTWGFSARDAALYYARILLSFIKMKDMKDGNDGLVWPRIRAISQIAQIRFDAKLQKRFAWARTSSLFRQVLTTPGTGAPWHRQCGPHFLDLVQILPHEGSATEPHGPLCTEHGRFWLYLNERSVSEVDEGVLHGILMVVPITMSWEANPWHHLHWWLPLIWYSKIFLQLDAEDVDIAFAFPHAEIDFRTSTAQGRNLDVNFKGHTEPEIWSVLQHDFPFKSDKAMMHWSPTGIHAGLLRWISAREAKPLMKYYGQSYQRLIMGLPSLRSFLQTPQIPCSSIAEVRGWVQGQFAQSMPVSKDGGRQG